MQDRNTQTKSNTIETLQWFWTEDRVGYQEAIALAIFKRLRAIYGVRFSANYSTEELLNEAMDEWAQSMANIHPQRILTALDRCRDYVENPPSIAEFRGIAVQVRIDEPKTLAISGPVVDRDAALAAIGKIKCGLGVANA